MGECSPITNLRRSLRPRRSTMKAMENEAIKLYRSPKKSADILSSEEISSDDSSDNDEYEKVQVTDTVSTNAALAGKAIYGFDKKIKHDRVIQLQTPSKNKKSNTLMPKTPHRLRKQIDKGIKSALKDSSSDEEAFQDSGSEYSDMDSESDNNDDDKDGVSELDSDSSLEIEPKLRKSTPPKSINTKIKTISTRKTAKQNNYIIKTEEYFSHSSNKVLTSNHTLDKLKTPRLSQDQLQKLLSQMKLSKVHQNAVYSLTETNREHFSKWLCFLHENFNILLYGLGSKKNLLNDFHLEMLSDSPVIVINGFFPSLTLKDILDAIVNDLLGLNENTSNVYDTVDIIAREMQTLDSHIYLIVHNIEGEMLRNNKSQNVLSHLGAIDNVHLIASIDHINAPLIWDHNKLSKFNFVWFDVTSYLPYRDETSFESSMMVQRTGNLALSSLRNVFLSLTSNSKGIYLILLKYQLEHNTNQYYQGLLFKDLYTSCREAFLVSSDLALRAQLNEFVDHKMVKLKRSAEGAEYLVIPTANNLLQQFLNEQKK